MVAIANLLTTNEMPSLDHLSRDRLAARMVDRMTCDRGRPFEDMALMTNFAAGRPEHHPLRGSKYLPRRVDCDSASRELLVVIPRCERSRGVHLIGTRGGPLRRHTDGARSSRSDPDSGTASVMSCRARSGVDAARGSDVSDFGGTGAFVQSGACGAGSRLWCLVVGIRYSRSDAMSPAPT